MATEAIDRQSATVVSFIGMAGYPPGVAGARLETTSGCPTNHEWIAQQSLVDFKRITIDFERIQ